MIEFNKECLLDILKNQDYHFYMVIPLIFIGLYALYLKQFKYYNPAEKQKWDDRRSNAKRGNPPPSYPNGWFRVCHKNELQIGQSKFFKINGRHITVFRGEDGIPYALHAYCSHMGANLGMGGKVKWNSCIECPFHGWSFDGKSGKCVNSEHLDEKQCSHHTYHDIKKMTKGSDNRYIKTCESGSPSQIQKFHVRQRNNLIYVWFHAKNVDPYYEPFEINEIPYLEDRGEVTDFVNCQIQEIPENGADFKHFEYIHYAWIEILFPWIKFKWVPKDRKPTDKDFDEVMRNHPNKKVQAFSNKLFDKYTNEQNKTYINNLVLDAYLVFFDKFEIYIQTATVFQLGSGTVFLFLKFPLWEAVVVQSVTPIGKFNQLVHHKMYTSWWLPYFVSAYLLAGFRKQFISDKVVWNNKIFADKLTYNPKAVFDERLLNWREWYSQYYEGCDEFEKSQEAFEW
ncbi:hypothetical protein ABPG72_016938 [Tetrahymena utriculariae]